MKGTLPFTAATVVLGLLAAEARAGEAGQARTGAVTLARHHTTNALDGPVEVADWYSQLRGSLTETVSHDLGTTRLTAGLDVRRYDRTVIENDASLALGTDTAVRVSETLELRGALSLRLVDEGDDIAVGDVILGTRTRRTLASASLQAGFRLAPQTVLAVEGTAARELSGKTRFQDEIAPPEKLDPDRTRLRAGAALTHTSGSASIGASVDAGLMRSGAAGLLAAFDRHDMSARIFGAYALDNGASLSGEIGVESVRLAGNPFRETGPAFAAAVVLPVTGALSLHGSLRAGYDLASTDDPLAVWARRAETEAGYRFGPAFRLGVGAFDEWRRFLAYGTDERGRGAFAEAAWTPDEHFVVLFRVDAVRRTLFPLGLPRNAIETQIAVTARL